MTKSRALAALAGFISLTLLSGCLYGEQKGVHRYKDGPYIDVDNRY